MMIDAHSDTPEFVKISEAKLHDKNFLQYLNLAAHSMIVFDRAYNHYLQFARWTAQQVNFVCRLKKNAVYQVQEVLFQQDLLNDEQGVLCEEHIHLAYREGNQEKTLCLRKVRYRDEKGRMYDFLPITLKSAERKSLFFINFVGILSYSSKN